jgi:hypothetical protein
LAFIFVGQSKLRWDEPYWILWHPAECARTGTYYYLGSFYLIQGFAVVIRNTDINYDTCKWYKKMVLIAGAVEPNGATS